MPNSILEVIALTPADARAARDGGADRIELVTDMGRQGLTPSIATFEAVRQAVDIPVRVMLRSSDGYALSAAPTLVAAAAGLRAAGADEFVLGFLDPHGAVDLAAVSTVLEAIPGCRWTFHRALDHAADRSAARTALAGLPGLDCILTAGGPETVEEGLTTLTAEAGSNPQILAGGGLRRHHVAPLLAAGVTAFHTGSAVRPEGRWDAPVNPTLVSTWRAALP